MSATRPVVNQTMMLMLLTLAACIPATAQTPLFTQCPHIGLSTGCAYLVVVMDGATTVLTDQTQLPFDAGDHTLVGVQNSSSTPIASLPLNGGAMAIFNFNGDGICSGFTPAPPGPCPFGPTGYEGPGTSFTNISADKTSGTVVFSPPIPPGGHAYFSLEGFITALSAPLQISCNPNAGPSQQGVVYSTTCTASGGPLFGQTGVPATPVYLWSIGSGSPPPGLSFSSTTGSTVTLSGIPDSVGNFAYSIQVSDNSVPSPQLASQGFNAGINQLGGVCNNTLSAGSVSVGPAAVASSVFVSSPPGCPQWAASSPVNWVTITGGATGTGNGTVNFIVSANGGLARSATLAIAGQSFVINQVIGCLFGIVPQKAFIAAGGASGSFSVGTLSSTCAWTAAPDSNSPWLTINGSASGTGSGAVSFTAAPNPSSNGRTGTIFMGGQVFTVIQAGSTCSFSLAQSAQAFLAAGGVGTATVQAPAGCAWPSTSSSVPWVTINAIGGSGNGTVSYTVQANPGTAASRTGTLNIAGQMYAVTQAGTSPLTCIASVAAPAQVAIEGRTEVLGDLVLSCGGILGSSVADISLTLNTNLTNAITGANIADAVLTVNGANPQNGLVSGYNIIHWPGVSLVPGARGVATVLISKIRADASLLSTAANLQSVSLTGLVTVNAVVPVPVTNALQTMAFAGPTLLVRRLPPTPSPFGIIFIPLQYQEATPTAFQSGAGTAPPTRLRLVLTNVPAGVQVLAPVFASEGTAQLYSADFNGNGGSPISGVTQSPLTVTGGVASATWVVLAADPTQFDTFTFLVSLQNVAGIDTSQVQATATLGPVSDVSVASATAPVPRYRDVSVLQNLVNLRATSSTLYPPLAFGAPPLAIFSNQLVNDNPNQSATNVVVRDRVTAGGIIQGCQATGGATCTVTGNEAVVTYGALEPGQSVNVTLQVGFDPTVPGGTVVQSLFSAVSDQPDADLSGSSSSAIYVTSGSVGNPSGSLTATLGTPQSTLVSTPFPAALQATLRDSAGNPVSGALVTFTAPTSGASAVLSSGTAVTNSSGVASVTATANGIAGSYNVTATSSLTGSLVALSTTFALTNLPGAPNSDLAQGKFASQSSTFPGYPSAGAGSAVDGNTDGNFFDGSVTATNLEANAWWQVDLGASMPISSIVIWNRTDCCGSRLNDYWVFVSDSPFVVPTDTPAILAAGSNFSIHQTSAPNPSTTIAAATHGRYIRIQLTNPNYLSLAEVQVFAGTDLAVGMPATQSSTLAGYPTDGAGSAVDGNTDGNFFDGSVTATNLDPNPWWQVDLGASTTIGSIVVWNRTDCCGSRLNDYWVFVSDTPFLPTDTPTTLQGRAGTLGFHQTTAPNPSAVIPAPCTGPVCTALVIRIQGRYVRVQLTNPNYLSLAEVQIFAPGTAPPPVEVASQSSTLPGYPTAAASSAIDGNTDGNFFDGSVTATNLDTNAWWQVDYGSSIAVNSVTIWNRTDCCGSRLNDYWLFVSNTPFLPTDTPATLQFRPGTFASHQTSAPNPTVTIPVGGQGRYVRVQLTGTNYLSLAEVQVQ